MIVQCHVISAKQRLSCLLTRRVSSCWLWSCPGAGSRGAGGRASCTGCKAWGLCEACCLGCPRRASGCCPSCVGAVRCVDLEWHTHTRHHRRALCKSFRTQFGRCCSWPACSSTRPDNLSVRAMARDRSRRRFQNLYRFRATGGAPRGAMLAVASLLLILASVTVCVCVCYCSLRDLTVRQHGQCQPPLCTPAPLNVSQFANQRVMFVSVRGKGRCGRGCGLT
jgi:hypothetical protein